MQKKAEGLNVIWFNELSTSTQRACDEITAKSQGTMIWNGNANASMFVTTSAGNKFGNGEIKILISLKANKVILPDGFLNINLSNNVPQQQFQQPMQMQYQQQPVQIQQQIPQQMQYQQPQPQSPQGQGQMMMVQLPSFVYFILYIFLIK